MFQSLIGIIEDFDARRTWESSSGEMFQSLIGIIEDFDSGVLGRIPVIILFQSLIGIIEDFDYCRSLLYRAQIGFNP